MNFFFLMSVLVAVVLPSGVFAETRENPMSCFETIQKELSPSFKASQKCVLERATEEFFSLCHEEGVETKTDAFERYLSYRIKYQETLTEAEAYFAANPGATQLPMTIATRIEIARTDWMGPGNRIGIEATLEKLRRKSVGCQ